MSDLPDIETPDVTLDFTDSLIGREFKGAYRIADKIGEGGFGTVYRAVQMVVNREVAIKVLRAERARDERLRDLLTKRFKREAVAMSKLSHPNTVQLIDFGLSDDGILFLVLELLKGHDLERVIRTEAPVAPARVARIGQQICQSLGEAHQQGIIHRDLKPANIFLCQVAGNPDFVKVMDFGIARLVDPGLGEGQITRTGMTQGTPAYMAPEQAMAKETTAASDLYAVGCILYEMLTGSPVFCADSAVAVGLAHVREKPPHLVLPGLDEEVLHAWDELLQRLFVKDPDLRPQTSQEVVDDLKRLEAMGGDVERVEATAVTVAVPSTPLHNAVAEAEAADEGAATDDKTEIAQSSGALHAAIQAADKADEEAATQMAPAVSEADQATQMAPAVSEAEQATQMAPAVSEAEQATQMAPAVSEADQATELAPAISKELAEAGGIAPRGIRATVLALLALLVSAGLTWALWPAAPDPAPGETATESVVAPATPEAPAAAPTPKAASPMPVTRENEPSAPGDRTHLVLRSFPGQVLVLRGQRVLCTTPCDMYVRSGAETESLIFRKDGYMEMSLAVILAPGLLERTVQLAPAGAPAAPQPAAQRRVRRTRAPAGSTPTGDGRRKARKPAKKALPGFRGTPSSQPASKPASEPSRGLPRLRTGEQK